MGYQALYRVYRPKTFAAIVGQTTITKTLENSVKDNHLSHAYLFTGPKGTGKTSMAKILAKAVNCENPQNGSPCNECEICRQIDNGQVDDVLEIDAASNNGVDQIRELRDQVKYAPTVGKFKVYIIDEVHMLSKGAFNALLKTLEEPPEHVIFILATTELNKVPKTIISRTQNFTFKKLTTKEIKDQLVKILNDISVKFEEDALELIARAAQGGMRDALSILDQVKSFSPDLITYDAAIVITNSARKEQILNIIKSFKSDTVEDSLITVQGTINDGVSSNLMIEELMNSLKDSLIFNIKQTHDELSDSYLTISELKEVTMMFSQGELIKLIELVDEMLSTLKYAENPDLLVQALIIKVYNSFNINSPVQKTEQTKPDAQENDVSLPINDTEKIQSQTADAPSIEEPEQGSMSINSEVVNHKESKPETKPSTAKTINKSDIKMIENILAQASKQDLNEVKKIYGSALEPLEVVDRALLDIARPVAADKQGVVVSFEYPLLMEKVKNKPELLEVISKSISNLLGREVQMVIIDDSSWQNIRSDYIKNHYPNEEKPSKVQTMTPTDELSSLLSSDIIEIRED